MTHMNKYTCNEYREEMILLSLRRRLNSEKISDKEKNDLLKQIDELEKKMEMD